MTEIPSKLPPFSSIAIMLFIQLAFISIPGIIIYWILTLNFTMLGACVICSILQHILIKGRSMAYVNFLTKIIKITDIAQFQRIYDGGQQDQNNVNVRTLFCYHPHSVYGYAIILNTNHPKFEHQLLSKAVIIGSNFALNLPLIGIHLKLWGITGADQTNFKKLLEAGKTVSLLPGGYEEATLTSTKQFRVYIKKRKGFIKYALKNNYPIRQVLVMNEHQAFWTFDGLLNIRLLLNTIKIPGVIFWGKWGPFFPPNIRMTTIIGKQIRGRHYSSEEEPTSQQIEALHKTYIEELVELYDRHKALNGNKQMKVY